jgi:hypothetical protein
MLNIENSQDDENLTLKLDWKDRRMYTEELEAGM